MSAFSDSYVLRVLLASPTPARSLDTVGRRWRWLRTSLVDPYRPELYYMRGPGPKWREKHAPALAGRTRAPKPRSVWRTA
jgi:hypothetical protein